MTDKQPRIRPHEQIMNDLAETGARMYHQPVNRYIKSYEQKLGQMSLTDGVPVIRDNVIEGEPRQTDQT